ncbi:YdcF family protein [Magnetospirillum moscoviense]|uniref:DUF218 domain-containing protein n=1 Tax=Magnetospirillum moscoviense TaxID=1437059 RepID=A0A178MC76_9PROT|nr:YdcF family protein [Magnetospirillum moscoviense]OAN46400.1 hypothetical protein A6A05_04035 [Magnetospirillum moscoviense]
MFILSKVVGILTNPTNLAFLIMGLATILLLTRWLRLGRTILLWECLALLIVAVSPLEEWLIAPLEDRFPPPAKLERVDGIVVLGGAIDPVGSALRGQPNAGGAIDRITAMIELSRRFPDATVIFTGGSGSLSEQDYKEATAVRQYLAQLGIDGSRILYEEQSRNTRENAAFSLPLANPRPGQVWLLVTSASHMPRSVGVFRAAGWQVTAWPVDYATNGTARVAGLHFNLPAGLGVLGAALHEWIGLVSYRLLGWTADWFPAP